MGLIANDDDDDDGDDCVSVINDWSSGIALNVPFLIIARVKVSFFMDGPSTFVFQLQRLMTSNDVCSL